MELPTFKLEEYFSKWEFKASYLFCSSDVESWSLKEILDLADPESLQLWEKLSLGYTETFGLPLLREEVASLYSNLSLENVAMFSGAEEGIYCAMQTLLSPDDHVITFTPCYQSLESLPKNLCHVTSIPLTPESGWTLDLEKVKAAIRPNTRLIIINFPHNPTGVIPKKETILELIDIARQQGAYIFSDEVYRFLELNEEDRLPSIAELYEKGISLSVMSKAFGLAGLRIGWLTSQDTTFLKDVIEMKYYTSICNSAPSEILALIGLKAKNLLLERNLKIIRNNFQLLTTFLSNHLNLFSWTPPQGGCIGFLNLLGQNSIDKFAQDLVHKKGVLILPASRYSYSENYFRIGFGRKNMPIALEKFEEFLHENLY